MQNRRDHSGSRQRTTLILVALVVAVAVILWLVMRTGAPAPEPQAPISVSPEPIPAEPPPRLEPEPEPEPRPEPEPEPEPSEPLPPLDESDQPVTQGLLEHDGNDLVPLLTNEHLLRKFVRAVNALEDGKLVHQYRPVNDPSLPFAVQTRDSETFTISANNPQRYVPYIRALTVVGSERLVEIFRSYAPLLEEAYGELGVDDKGSFEEVTLRAIDQLLAAPPTPEEILLNQPSVMYQFKDEALEELPPAQKLMLRLGPENRAQVERLLREIRAELQS